LGIKISHGCREIAFCPVGYFNLSHPVHGFGPLMALRHRGLFALLQTEFTYFNLWYYNSFTLTSNAETVN